MTPDDTQPCAPPVVELGPEELELAPEVPIGRPPSSRDRLTWRIGTLAMALGVVLAGCAWIDAHDPVVKPTLTADCTGLGEESCGRGGCCDGWHDWHCNAVAQRCEWSPDVNRSLGASHDAGADR